MKLIQGLLQNKVLVTAVTAWVTAQLLKVLTNYFKEKKVNVKRLVGAGGMPSSHTALVVSLAASIGLYNGWNSPLFAVVCVLAGIVMYDAAGVRRAAGKQAKVLNKLIADYHTHHAVRDGRLKELLGHTPIEVFAGALLGIGMAYYIYLYW
jgi:acid phosphatase family membrane protein YuiD